jgi:hypothetical protein
MVFSGHNHCYERSVAVKADKPDSNGVVYLTVGPAGAKTDGIVGDWFTAASYQDWTTYNNQEEQSGYMLITVSDDGVVTAQRKGIANTVQDSFIVGKSRLSVRSPGAPLPPHSINSTAQRISVPPPFPAGFDIAGRSIHTVRAVRTGTAEVILLPSRDTYGIVKMRPAMVY